MKYPEMALDAGIGGRVFLRFVVSETGNISNVKVQRGIPDCKECDEEAVRVVRSMPAWKPGKNNGKAVNQWYNLPIRFNPG
jgi:protein TonB